MGRVLITVQTLSVRFCDLLWFSVGRVWSIPPWPPNQECIHTRNKILSVPYCAETFDHILISSDVPCSLTLAYTKVSRKACSMWGPIIIGPCCYIISIQDWALIGISIAKRFNLIPIKTSSFDDLIAWQNLLDHTNSVLKQKRLPVFFVF